MNATTFRRIGSVARKELLHIVRDPQTLFFTLMVPIFEMFLLGYAINTNVRHVRTAILDRAATQESRALLRRFENSNDFDVIEHVYSEQALRASIVAGRARVGIVIPEDYSRRLLAGRTAQVLVLIDGSESGIAAEMLNVSNAIALRESLERALHGRALPVEARPQLLFNPDTRSANFFLPGLIIVMCQMMATIMAANAIVREKEFGTIEQLFMTPVKPAELILGKMAPYLVLTVIEFCLIALLMRTAFGVPIRGPFLTLLAIVIPFVLTMVGMGLMISNKADTRDAAMQMTMGTILPSIFLSGYVFPTDSMPEPFATISLFIPTTWMIDACRGVVLRGAGWSDLWPHAAILGGMAATMLTLGSLQFRKRLT